MNNLKKLLVVFALFSVVSCMDEDISKISNTIEIQPNIAIPYNSFYNYISRFIA